MLLRLLGAAEYQTQKGRALTGGIGLPEPESLHYPDPDSLYTGEVAGRLNSAVSENHPGHFDYLLSHIAVQAHTPLRSASAADDFARIGLASAGRLMLDEIDRSGQQFSARA